MLFKYQIGSGFISPSIAVGKETGFVFTSKVEIEEAVIDQDKPKDLMIHPTTKGGWFGEIGLNFKLGRNLSLFSNIRVQSGKNLIILEGNQRAGYNTVVKSSDFVKEYKTNYSTLLVGLKFQEALQLDTSLKIIFPVILLFLFSPKYLLFLKPLITANSY